MRIAIAGYGVEGRVNYNYFQNNYPESQVVIVDERTELDDVPTDVEALLGEGAFERLQDFDMVVRTAGLAPGKIKTSGKIWSATNEFFDKCPAKIIGVTGTKGKGTTASLIASILEAQGRKVHLVGNIGVPALELLPGISSGDIVVYELSSFQLWDIEKSPYVGVVLMIESDHLDVHDDFEDYVLAKANISKYQSTDDVTIYHPTNKYSADIARLSAGKKMRYGVAHDGGAYVELNKFFVQNNAICSVDTLHLVGPHNWENACAAITAARIFGVSDEAIERGLANFKGLEHRLKFVAEVDGVKYYDDSIATTPGSAIAAIMSFEQPKIMIIGGHDKGGDYGELAELIAADDSVRMVLLVGSSAEKLSEVMAGAGVEERVLTLGMVSMEETIEEASRVAVSGDVVILSPAAASFDQYTSYHDRGERFIEAVGGLA